MIEIGFGVSIGGEGMAVIGTSLTFGVVVMLALGLTFISLVRLGQWGHFAAIWAWIGVAALSQTEWIAGVSVFMSILSVLFFIKGGRR